MAMLMAMCPRCRTETNTGISADVHTMQELGPTLAVLVLCDSCSEYHRMMVKDLHFGEPEAAVA